MKNIKNTRRESKSDVDQRGESTDQEEKTGSEEKYGKDEEIKLGLGNLQIQFSRKKKKRKWNNSK